MAFLDQFPYYEGGTTTLNLELTKYGRTIRGSYTSETTVLSERERDRLWKKAAKVSYSAKRIRGGIQPGQRQSRTVVSTRVTYGQKPPVVVRGLIRDIPPALADLASLQAGVHPRILPADLASVKKSLATTYGKQWLQVLTTTVADKAGVGGALRPGDAIAGHGLRAAGLAWQAWATKADTTKAQLAAIQRCLDEECTKSAKNRWGYARAIAGLALAYDLAGTSWPNSVRENVADHLARAAWHISGLEEPHRKSIYNDSGLLGTPEQVAVPRLGMLRGAGALAALVVLGDERPIEGSAPTHEQVSRAYEACVRSLHRFFKSGFGASGAPIGHSASDECVELLMPIAFAIRHATQIDVLDRTGARHIPRWILQTGGRMFDAGPRLNGSWLALSSWRLPCSRSGSCTCLHGSVWRRSV